jgi:glycerol-3-phosphate dehydrogenase (NAD(P)+)
MNARKIAIIGTTSWGTALAVMLSRKGVPVAVWARTDEERTECLGKNGNAGHFECTVSEADCVRDAGMVIWAVPAQSLRRNVQLFTGVLNPGMVLVSAAKGLEVTTGKRMSEVMSEEIGHHLERRVGVLSGPNLAREVLQNLPAATVIASRDPQTLQAGQEILDCPNFHVFASRDVAGIELCGALKNIVALGAGMVDGMELGDNAKGAFIALAWQEMTALGVSMGAEAVTFWGVAGLGDLFATCASTLSRNHYVGAEVGKGRPLLEVLAGTPYVAEGVDTTMAVHNLRRRHKVELPICELVYDVLFEAMAPQEALSRFKGLIDGLPPAPRKRY